MLRSQPVQRLPGRQVRPAALLAVLLAATMLLPGCFTPFRAHVDPAVLTAELAWTESQGASTGGGTGPRYVENEYTFKAGNGPPYPAVLQVFSVRDVGRRSTEDLRALTRQLVEESTAAKGIRLDPEAVREGTRTLQNGLQTLWFSHDGTVSSTGPLFQQQNVRVYIVGEVGYDGRSSTSVVAVGIAQVESTQCAPLVPACQTNRDLRSWNSMAGDPAGSLRDARSQHGLIHNLVTHG